MHDKWHTHTHNNWKRERKIEKTETWWTCWYRVEPILHTPCHNTAIVLKALLMVTCSKVFFLLHSIHWTCGNGSQSERASNNFWCANMKWFWIFLFSVKWDEDCFFHSLLWAMCVTRCVLSKNGSNETKTKAEKKENEKQQKIHRRIVTRAVRVLFICILFGSQFGGPSLYVCEWNRKIKDLCLVHFWFFQRKKKPNKCRSIHLECIFLSLSISFFLSVSILLLLLFSIVFHQFHVSHISIYSGFCDGVTIWNRK